MDDVVSCAKPVTGTISASKIASADKQSRNLLFIDFSPVSCLQRIKQASQTKSRQKQLEYNEPNSRMFGLLMFGPSASYQPLEW